MLYSTRTRLVYDWYMTHVRMVHDACTNGQCHEYEVYMPCIQFTTFAPDFVQSNQYEVPDRNIYSNGRSWGTGAMVGRRESCTRRHGVINHQQRPDGGHRQPGQHRRAVHSQNDQEVRPASERYTLIPPEGCDRFSPYPHAGGHGRQGGRTAAA